MRRLFAWFRRPPPPLNGFLRDVETVLHVGANLGQERDEYAALGLNVIWVEPIPSVFEELQARLEGFPKQRAYRALISDCDGARRVLHVANNGGASSSILELAEQRSIWPDVYYTHDLELDTTTLSTLVRVRGIELRGRTALVLDTQGSELLILKGAADLLERFRYIKTEAADFNAYQGCCTLAEITSFLKPAGFRLRQATPFISRPGTGTYFDVLYARK